MANEEQGMRDRILDEHGIKTPQQGSFRQGNERRKPQSLYDAKPRKTGLDRYHESVERRIGKRMKQRLVDLANKFRRQS